MLNSLSKMYRYIFDNSIWEILRTEVINLKLSIIMSHKNETTLLALAFLITVGLVGGGFWLFFKSSGLTTSPLKPSNNPPQSQASNPQTFAQVQNVPSGLISYGGSTTWAPVRKEIIQ